jgi:hypothetical protein
MKINLLNINKYCNEKNNELRKENILGDIKMEFKNILID